MAENKRIKMTKRIIKEALLELLESFPLEKITVTQICEVAEVNRSTYYVYYEDVSQLMTEIENDVLEMLPVSTSGSMDYSDEVFMDAIEQFLDYVKENERLFRILILQRDNNSFNLKLIDRVMERYAMTLKTSREIPARLSYIYCTSGAIGLMREWISSDFQISSRELTKLILQLCAKATS